MPIAALPPNTVRAVGSTQTLSDSASVVKELVDNALDAHASAICVEISTNALDVIQVKDNGQGIAPEDRGLVCRRFCTSKIRSFEDITNIGGSSLGFRGEALASAAETCGGLVISTRVEGEAVGVCMRFTRQGETLSEEPTSHPIGTTIRIVDFLNNLPVRRQTALKSSTKTFTKIRKTLEAYALARPSTRISLKVLKAKNDKGNWTYAPRIGSSVVDAAIKVFGKKVTDQCHWTTWEDLADTKNGHPAAGVQNNEVLTADTSVDFAVGCKYHERPARYTFSIQALLPKIDCDFSAISNAGQYLAIDSRPVSCARGTLKHVIGVFKSYVRASSPAHNTELLNNPVLCMNIECPPGSYDVNVEPAKDDVLFTDSEMVLQIVEKFLGVAYGDLPTRDGRTTSKKASATDLRNFDVMLASKKEREIPSSASTTSSVPGLDVEEIVASRHLLAIQGKSQDVLFSGTKGSTNYEARGKESKPIASTTEQDPFDKPPRAWQGNMYAENELDDDDLSVAGTRNVLYSDDETDAGGDLEHVSVSNPWTIAKINAPIRRTPHMSAAAGEFADGDLCLHTPLRQSGDVEGRSLTVQGGFRCSKSSAQFPLTPKPTQRSSPVRPESLLSSPSPFPFPMKAWGKGGGSSGLPRRRKQVAHDGAGGDLETWIHQAPDCSQTEPQDGELNYETPFNTHQLRRNGFVSARTLPTGTPLTAIPEAAERRQTKSAQRKQLSGALNKPFMSPIKDPERDCFEVRPRCNPKPLQTQLRFARNSQVSMRSDGEEPDSVGEMNTVQASPASARQMHPDLVITMDYERRKQEATRKLREQLREQVRAQHRSRVEDGAAAPSIERNSPHKNRYNSAVAALAPPSVQENPILDIANVFEPGDPRGYLIRCQNRENAGLINPVEGQAKAKRRKTSMLPLEVVLEESTVRELILTIGSSKLPLTNTVSIKKYHDDYMSTGAYVNGLACAPADFAVWAARLSNLLKGSYRKENGGEIADLSIDLSYPLTNHLAAYA